MRFGTIYRTIAVVLVIVIIFSNLVRFTDDGGMFTRDLGDSGSDEVPGIDSDGDGLRDTDEDLNRNGRTDEGESSPTDPYNKDTDGDGLEDGDEYDLFKDRSVNSSSTTSWISTFGKEEAIILSMISSLSPTGDIDKDGLPNILDPDSDGDTILDGEEVERGLDPLDPDTDGDTVPDPLDPNTGFSVDSDGDGLDDVWETYHSISNPAEDPDGDGISNLLEFTGRTDPNHMDDHSGHIGSYTASGLLRYPDPYRIHFTVEGLGPSYLRVSSFDDFDGSDWVRGPYILPEILGDEETSSATINMNGAWWGYLPTPYETSEAVNSTPYSTFPHREVEIPQFRGDVLYSQVPVIDYSISIRSMDIDLNSLERANASAPTTPGLLDIDPSIPSEVWDLAGRWDRSDISDFKKAGLIISRLSENYQFSKDPIIGTDTEDPLYEFLYIKHKGNALDFSTAFTILMRMYDIPSRVVVGYAVGEGNDGGRIYREGHLHAWSEILLKDLGWVQFEVTRYSWGMEGGSGISGDGVDPHIYGPIGGNGGGTLKGDIGGPLDPLGNNDGDNLTNGFEQLLGTDPNLTDSDGDGLDDHFEYYIYKTDPTLRDTDNDLLSDGEEVNDYRTEPLEPDTDLGGLNDGIEVHYKPHPLDPLNRSDDYRLTDVDMDGLNATLEKEYQTSEYDNDTDRDGLLDGHEVFSYKTDPLDPDSDDDILSDLDEIKSYYTNPLLSDTDGDGLSDREEVENGTDPRSDDTDRDGAEDGREIFEGTDPLDPDSDDDGLLDGYEFDRRTNPLLLDTDGDGIIDSLEEWYGLNPLTDQGLAPPPDMDHDGIPDDTEAESETIVSNNDSDGDGIPDGMELFMVHTNPVMEDSDGDGLDDWLEVMVEHTDPLRNDTDGDHLQDRFETGASISPVHPDTDGDGLFDGRELIQGTDPLDPDSDNGGLRDGLEVLLGKDPVDPYDDLPFLFDQDGDGLLDLIEADLGTDPLDPDSDDDGLPDGDEVIFHSTDPLDKFSDQDGLDDGREVLITGTDPLLEDTDFDGLWDGEELEDWGTQPLKNDTDGDGLMDGLEVQIYLTDPNDPDTDRDGLSDGREVFHDLNDEMPGIQGTDPTLKDTDKGGAPDGIELDRGGDPLDGSDDGSYIDSDGDGLLDVEEDKDGDGSLDANETDPDDSDTDDDDLIDGYEINGVLGPSTDPRNPDTDNDNITDGEEVLPGEDTYVTDPTLKDTDNDTIQDDHEVLGTYGSPSDPSSSDGDEDGLKDQVEVFISFTDPLDPDTDEDGLPDGWIDGWRDLPKNGKKDKGEFEDRDLDGLVDSGMWGNGAGPGETDPLDPDTDDGGVTDGQELFYKGSSDPLIPFDDEIIKDTDGDGLSDLLENGTSYLTRWDDPDTDNDGLADGYETIVIDEVTFKGELTGQNGFDPSDPMDPDTDSDGILDGAEVEQKTDPHDQDTDGDGLWDGYDEFDGIRFHLGELTGHHGYLPTDPLNFDTDGDGLHDGRSIDLPSGDKDFGEYFYETDPNDQDTDRDGLDDKYEISTFYKEGVFKYLGQLRTDPTDHDSDHGGMPDGLEVNLSLNPLNDGDDRYMIDDDGDGLTNGQEMFEIYYNPNDPRNDNVDWNNDRIPDGYTDPEDADTDGDGLGDGEEYYGFGTNPLSMDSDGDGLGDWQEVEVYGTDPTSSDTDNDDLPDGYEVLTNYTVSYVDWTGDGMFDHKTDPKNRDTDLDSITDGNEILDETPTNPLDSGDPGIELLPEETPFIFIESAPEKIQKEAELLKGAFRVSGIVRNEDGNPVPGIGVSIMVLERGSKRNDAVLLEGSPGFRVGSTDATSIDGRYTITCIPNPGTPFGEVSIFAVARDGISESRRFGSAASDPFQSVVATTTRIVPERSRYVRSQGAIVLVQGQLMDSGDVPVPEAEIILTSPFTSPVISDTDIKGYFRFTFRIPTTTGSWNLNLSYAGELYLGPSSEKLEIVSFEGPSISLDPIDPTYVSGDMVFINGTIGGGPEVPQGAVNISFLQLDGLRSITVVQGPIRSGGFSVPVTLNGETFPSGDYVVSVSYEIPGIGVSDNSSLSFQLLGRTVLFVPEPQVERGLDPFLFIQLFQENGDPISGGTIKVIFQELPWLDPRPQRTNITGWAVFEIELQGDVPLGYTPMRVEHVAGSGDIVPAIWTGLLSIRAPVSLEILSASEELIILDSVVIAGRLVEDTGIGIVGDGFLELLLNGESIGFYSTSDGGWFDIRGLVPQYPDWEKAF